MKTRFRKHVIVNSMVWNAASTLDKEKDADIIGQMKDIDGDAHEYLER